MLTITTDAAEAIRAVKRTLDLPDSAGLRISSVPYSQNGTGPTFAVELAPSPSAEDEVLDEGDAQVFVDPGASSALDDKTLDADLEVGGEVRFTLREQ